MTEIIRREAPEERELNKKQAELAALESTLAQRELDLATLQAELHAFEARYLRIVGTRYSELDEIEAQIAEAQARLEPDNKASQERAAQARAQAQDSAKATGNAQEQRQQKGFKPSEKLKKLYREIAKLVHPDLATYEKERVRRHKIMAEVNRAYEAGDEARLEAILREWDSSPESVKGEGVGAELIRIIRKIAQVEERLRIIDVNIVQLKESDLYKLKIKVEAAEQEGRDLLAEMAAQVAQQIVDARRRLAEVIKKRAEV